MGLSLLSRVSPIRVANDARAWRDLNGDSIGRITQLGPTYGRVANIQRGRLIKVGFNVDF